MLYMESLVGTEVIHQLLILKLKQNQVLTGIYQEDFMEFTLQQKNL